MPKYGYDENRNKKYILPIKSEELFGKKIYIHLKSMAHKKNMFKPQGSLYQSREHTSKHNVKMVLQYKTSVYHVPYFLSVTTIFPESFLLYMGTNYPFFILIFME